MLNSNKPKSEKIDPTVAWMLKNFPEPEGTWHRFQEVGAGSSPISRLDFDGWMAPNGDIYQMSGREGHNQAAIVALGFHTSEAKSHAIKSGYLYLSMQYDAGERGPESALIVSNGAPITKEQACVLRDGFGEHGCIRLSHGDSSELITTKSQLEQKLKEIVQQQGTNFDTASMKQPEIAQTLKFTIRDPGGFHGRCALHVVNALTDLDCRVTAKCLRSEDVADASSILQLMMMDIREGDSLELTVSGADCEAALTNLSKLPESGLYIAEGGELEK